MKKFIVKFKGSEKIFGKYISRKEAANELTDYIHDFNKENKNFESIYLSPFDFFLEEVECEDVNEVITCFDSAKRYLKLEGPNEKNTGPLIALDQLFTIAEAWNKADGFVADFLDMKQKKWFPRFKYDENAAGFVFGYSVCSPPGMDAYLGSLL